ncbi:MAG TPA: YdeI/OmpD-associated family protein [bacterium]|nr:YdeI/OmpD-associated family protein [bacterium]
MKITQTLYVHQVSKWRAWLKKNHMKAKEIWLIYYKKNSGKPRISYNDAVDEAICFGWIDSTVKKLDKDRFCQRFTPRKPGSPCSEMNKARAHRLIKEGRMTPAGRQVLEGVLSHGAKITSRGIHHPQGWKVSPDILKAIQRNKLAWKHYQRFPETYKRIRIAFIEGARKRPEEFRRRLNSFLGRTAKNQKFGMIQE